ncbi:MAG: FkbM family methyltransferase [Mariprofundales bacterium]
MKSKKNNSFYTNIKRWVQRWLPSSYYAERSWSQFGEDRIIVNMLQRIINENRPIEYVDIGANHPFHFNNTALLYKMRGHGFLIEPNPQLARVLSYQRSRDHVYQCGISNGTASYSNYYMFSSHTLNTFSTEEAKRYQTLGYYLLDTIKVELVDINEILKKMKHIDFMNLDVEGFDFDILQKVDWKNYRPSMICVETIEFEVRKEPRKRIDIIDYMKQNNYIVYADTYVNTIFVDSKKWSKLFLDF